MNRPVGYVRVQTIPFVENMPQFKSALSPALYRGMKLTAITEGVVVDYQDRSFIIPWGNVVCATFSGPDASEAQQPAPKLVVAPQVA